MPSNKNTERVAEAEQYFRKQCLDTYDLEDDFVDKLCEFLRGSVEKYLSTLAVPKSSPKNTDKPKPKRKKSAYNLYVREMMKTEAIQGLDHKEKMSAIAKEWKTVKEDTDAVAVYLLMAKEENESATETSE